MLVRILHCHGRPLLPCPFCLFSWSLCCAFELTSPKFSPVQRFSKFPDSTAWCSKSISYVRVRCPPFVQKPVFGTICATIVQPRVGQNYDGSSRNPVPSRVSLNRKPRKRRPPRPSRFTGISCPKSRSWWLSPCLVYITSCNEKT
jgi:hypothetical protein